MYGGSAPKGELCNKLCMNVCVYGCVYVWIAKLTKVIGNAKYGCGRVLNKVDIVGLKCLICCKRQKQLAILISIQLAITNWRHVCK